MDLERLDTLLADWDEPSFRAGQVWEWLARGGSSYEEMTNLPAAVRDRLADALPLSTLSLEQEARASDGTEKSPQAYLMARSAAI